MILNEEKIFFSSTTIKKKPLRLNSGIFSDFDLNPLALFHLDKSIYFCSWLSSSYSICFIFIDFQMTDDITIRLFDLDTGRIEKKNCFSF